MTAATQIRLANDVAAQFRHLPPDAGAAAVATHLRMFWAPSMRKQLQALADQGADDLDPLAAAASRLLR